MRNWSIQTLTVASLLATSCQAFGNPPSGVTPRADPRFIFSLVPSKIGPTRVPSQMGWPAENWVFSEYDLVSVDWDARNLTFAVDNPDLLQPLNGGGIHFSITYDAKELVTGPVYWVLPAIGVVDWPALYVENGVSDKNLAVVILENYNLREPSESRPLVIEDISLDHEIGQYLESIVDNRPR